MYPTLADLPPPPAGKTGFPWTEASNLLVSAESKNWPQVTIVTPSYNQGLFIEETIRSVLLQGYPNLEYIILDGGSTDNSVEIIRRYTRWLAFWISEPDRGQADAVGRGWDRGSGTILAYLNSDDTYLPNAMVRAVTELMANISAPAVCGGELLIDSEGRVISERLIRSATWHDLIALNFIPQPAVFLRRAAYDQVGGLTERTQISFDFELWTRLAQLGDFVCVPEIFATTRWHVQTKTLTQRPKIIAELRRIVNDLLASSAGSVLPWHEQRYIRARLNYVLLGIYLEDSTKFEPAIVANYVSALWLWLPIASQATRMLFGNLYYRLVQFYLYQVKRQTSQPQPYQSNQGIRWNDWHTRHNEEK